MTVKELLQQRRAKQARVAEMAFGERSEPVPSGGSVFPPCAAPYLDAAPESSWSGCLQPWPFQNWASCDEIPSYLEELVDSCLQAELPLDIPLALAQDNLLCSPESFQTPLTCLGSGSPEVPGSSSSFDYSHIPTQVSPFAPLGFSSPSLDAKNCMYPSSEENACQQHAHLPPTSGLSCCTPCGSQHLDTLRVPEYSPYGNVDCRDYATSVTAADDFWKDRSWDTCYS